MKYLKIASNLDWVLWCILIVIYIIFNRLTVCGFSKNYFKIRVHGSKKFLNIYLMWTIFFIVLIDAFFVFYFILLIYLFEIKKYSYYSFFFRNLIADALLTMLINIILFLGINLVKKYKKNRFHYPKSGMFGLWLNGLLFSKVTWWSKMSDFDEKIIRGRLKDEIENIKTLDDLIGLLSIIEESEKKWKSKFNKFWYDKMLFHIYEEKFDKITIESFFDLIKELDRKTNGV